MSCISSLEQTVLSGPGPDQLQTAKALLPALTNYPAMTMLCSTQDPLQAHVARKRRRRALTNGKK